MRTRHRSTFVRRSVAALAVMTAASVVLVQCTAAPPPSAAGPPPPPRLRRLPAPRPHLPSRRPLIPSLPPNSARAGVRVARWDRSSCGGLASTTSVSTARRTVAKLIVHEELVSQVITIFEQLYQLRYPIEKIRTVDQYPAASDELQMEDNNTSAFSCRDIPGTGRWSQHAYGRAVDVNPLLNPYIDATGAFQPKTAAAYLDRSRTDPGLLHGSDPARLHRSRLAVGRLLAVSHRLHALRVALIVLPGWASEVRISDFRGF